MDNNYVYMLKTTDVSSSGWMTSDIRLYKNLEDVLKHMEWCDLVFLNKEQIERLKHGDAASFTSKSKRRHEGSFTIGIIESIRIK